MPGIVDLPGPIFYMDINHPGITTAATTSETVIGFAPFAAKVVGAWYVPATVLTGAATNNRQLDVVSKAASGGATAQVASVVYTGSVVATALANATITASATAANANVAANDVLTVQSLVNGSGLAMPPGSIVVALQAR